MKAQTAAMSPMQNGVVEPDTTHATEERLVAIAMTRPSYDQTYRTIRIAEHDLSKARNEWLNLLTVTLNYNELDFSHNTTNQYGYVYPKYFFGVTIPLGFFISRSSDIKLAKEQEYIALDQQQEMARTIRATIIGRYRAYIVYQDQLNLQTDVINGEKTAFLEVEKDFRDGKTSLALYNLAAKSYSNEVMRKLSIQLLSDQCKTDIEQALGMTLESALAKQPPPPPAAKPVKRN
jgi:outer membrane protein TolC